MCHVTGVRMAKVSTWRLMDEHIGDCSYYMADIEPHHRGLTNEWRAGCWFVAVQSNGSVLAVQSVEKEPEQVTAVESVMTVCW